MRRYIVVSVGVLAFVALVGAVLHTILALTREPSVVMSDTACTPPCWNSIRPGITTADEVFHLLNGSRTVDPLSLSERRSADEVVSTSWHFSPPSPDGTGRAYYIDETVAAIVIGTFGSVDLEEMLTKLGQPSYSWNYCEGGAEQSWTRILLFWPDGGYAVAVDSDPRVESPTNHSSRPPIPWRESCTSIRVPSRSFSGRARCSGCAPTVQRSSGSLGAPHQSAHSHSRMPWLSNMATIPA